MFVFACNFEKLKLVDLRFNNGQCAEFQLIQVALLMATNHVILSFLYKFKQFETANKIPYEKNTLTKNKYFFFYFDCDGVQSIELLMFRSNIPI